MPRPRERVCLQDGLKLDINRLAQKGFVKPRTKVGPYGIRWTYTYTDEAVAFGRTTANMEGTIEGWFRIQIGNLDQWIILVPRPRHFGGYQWYFMCPVMNHQCSVLWMPPGAKKFASRQSWGRQVAYASQFQSRYDRALSAAQSLRSRLAEPEWARLDGTDPPKPKWMRWGTYNRILDRADAYESIADEKIILLAAQWLGRS